MFVKKVFVCNIIMLVYFISEIECAKILAIFPVPSISHQIVFRPLTHELAKRGHEVTVITPDPVYPKEKAPFNLTEIDVHDISYSKWDEILKKIAESASVLEQIKLFLERFAATLEVQLQTTEAQEILKKDRKYYDLIITEACIRPLMGIEAIFDAPIIQFSSLGIATTQYNFFGAPTHPLLFPTPGRERLYNLSLLEKGVELFKHVIIDYLVAATEDFDYGVMQRNFGQDVPTFSELYIKQKMIFVNEHPIWSDNHPVGPNVIYVGGIHLSNYVEKELPKDLKSYLDSSKHGVIYMSLGTNAFASSLPNDKIEAIKRVFSQLPYDVLFKWDIDVMPGKPENVKITKWVPQTDLLRHPKIKLFVTQGGLQSTDEAIAAGVPLIGIPLMFDQVYNVEKYVKHNIGIQLNIDDLDEKSFKEAIVTVINNESYKRNITRLRELMRERPIKPLDLAVYWAEHVIKHGADHLQPPTVGVGWIEYYEIRLVLLALSILISLLVIIALVIRIIAKKIYKLLVSPKFKLE